MTTKCFRKATFWAREFRIPLFWLTDKRHKIFGENTLVFYKNSLVHAYHLNDREIKAAGIGYKFFTNKSNLTKYKKEVEEIRNLIRQIAKEYKSIKVNKLSDVELRNRCFDMLRFLALYSNVYARTEPFMLSKIEANETKYKNLIKELGESRFILRREGMPLFYTLFGVLLKEAARRLNLKMPDLFFYTHNEMVKLFKGRRVRKGIVERRKKGYALISFQNKKTLLTGGKFKKLYKEIVLTKPKLSQLIGRIAMKGKARGKVRVILHNKRIITQDVARFKKGEILVTEMTRPDTALACRRAAAIVTDEGGITSHAAIISRELKIPCIIGTKIATKVLKDGDLVDVDAKKGIVRKIKNQR